MNCAELSQTYARVKQQNTKEYIGEIYFQQRE